MILTPLTLYFMKAYESVGSSLRFGSGFAALDRPATIYIFLTFLKFSFQKVEALLKGSHEDPKSNFEMTKLFFKIKKLRLAAPGLHNPFQKLSENIGFKGGKDHIARCGFK